MTQKDKESELIKSGNIDILHNDPEKKLKFEFVS